MAQPDLGQLAQNIRNAGNELQTASNGITLLRNLPPIHDRQAAHNNHQQLVELIQGLNTHLNEVNARLGNIDARLHNIDARITTNDHNLMARSLNSSVNMTNIQLSPLRTPNNQDMAEFPNTMHALNNLNGVQVDHLLRTFALPVNGNLDIKKRRFQSFIGVPWGV